MGGFREQEYYHKASFYQYESRIKTFRRLIPLPLMGDSDRIHQFNEKIPPYPRPSSGCTDLEVFHILPRPLRGEGRGEGKGKGIEVNFIPPHPSLLPPGEKAHRGLVSEYKFLSLQH